MGKGKSGAADDAGARRAKLALVSDPPRKIIHLDMDAFYASVEQREDPSLRGKPVAVGGSPQSRGVVAACNYEARRFGVRSAMPMARALRQCPDLVLVRPNFTLYKEVSQQVMSILRSATPLVEPLSLDEAYLDVTENLLNEPLAMEVAKYLKARIRDELSLTASAGVAPNKFLAKIASGWKKPDGLTVIAPERVETFLQKLPVEALWGVGPVTARKLHGIGVIRLVDVRAADRALLTRTVGSLAEWLLQVVAWERSAQSDAGPPVEVDFCRGYLCNGSGRRQGDASGNRKAGAASGGFVAEKGIAGAHGDISKCATRTSPPSRAAIPRNLPPTTRRGSSSGRSRCLSAPTHRSAPCGCWGWACTACASLTRLAPRLIRCNCRKASC